MLREARPVRAGAPPPHVWSVARSRLADLTARTEKAMAKGECVGAKKRGRIKCDLFRPDLFARGEKSEEWIGCAARFSSKVVTGFVDLRDGRLKFRWSVC